MRALLARSLIEVGAEDRLEDVSDLIKERNASHCVVVERPRGEFLGVVRIRDAVTKPAARIFADLISDLPAYRVGKVEPRQQVLQLLAKDNPEDAVVLSARGEFVGVVTRQSVLEWKRAEHAGQSRSRELNDTRSLLLREKLRRKTDSLNQAIAQLEELSYAVSHDVRAPLRAMRGYAQALQDDYGTKLDETGNDYVRRIIRSSHQLDRLTMGLLAYNEIARAKLLARKVDLAAVIAEVVARMRVEKPDAEIVVDELMPVRADRALLVRCVSELLSNALKFMPEGRKPIVRVWTVRSGDGVILKIQDNGIGLRPEHRTRVFQLFEQVHGSAVFGGIGIGLALVRAAAEKMGGRTGVELRAPGEGSCFWLRLPA